MIELKIIANDAIELNEQIAGLAKLGLTATSLAGQMAAAPTFGGKPDVDAVEAPKTTRKKPEPKGETAAPTGDVEPPKAETPAAAPEPETPKAQDGGAQAAASDPAPAGDAIPYDNVRALILKVAAEKGRDAAANVLDQFGVAKGTDLKPEQYAEAISLLEQKLAA